MKPFAPAYFFDLESFQFASIFDNCLYVWDVLPKITTFLKNQQLGLHNGHVSEGAYLINPEQITIGAGTIVEPGAYIKGPCLIGENCTIRHGAYIRGNVITGNHCVVGHDSEVKNSLLLDHAKAAHFAYLGDSILGNHVNLGAGTKCANLRLDNESITIPFEGHRIETGLRKFGAILGDHCEIGCNSVTNPGSVFGQQVSCYPNTNVGGFVPSRYLIKPQNRPVLVPPKEKV